eukprot:COSAG02_NODE_2169_length_9601_cov_233.346138_5_plen_298_part_00
MGQRCSSCSSSATAGPPHQPPDQETTKLVDDAVVAQTKPQPAAAEEEGTVIGVEVQQKGKDGELAGGGVTAQQKSTAGESTGDAVAAEELDEWARIEEELLDEQLADLVGGVSVAAPAAAAPAAASTDDAEMQALQAMMIEKELGDADVVADTPGVVEWTVKQLVEGIFTSWEDRVLQLQEASGKMRLCGPRRPDGNAGAVIEGTENQLYGCTVSVLKKPRDHNGPCSEGQSAFRLQLADGTTFKMVPVPDTRSRDDVLERTNTVWHSGKHSELKQMLEHLSKKLVPETSIEISANS